MQTTRRGFISAFAAAFSAASAAPAAVLAARHKFGANDGDITFGVMFQGVDGLQEGVESILVKVRAIDRTKYRFDRMPLPKSVDKAAIMSVKGVPMRHVQCWDAITGDFLNRVDVLARRI
tara:strand:+ start:57 stop:416 length:360 start_codon:yes stop_codon:yes gene_type:complete